MIRLGSTDFAIMACGFMTALLNDYVMALRIYQKYLEAKKMGTFDALLSEIYQEGRKYNFRPPNAPIIGIAGAAARFGPHARTQSSDY
ncbi:hypothetical protein BASA82_000373 [Batrachochytrium salamandrivorans]|nr:hypothetical protein BASA82_000373 [Batrachochytrium salamandrivorans]